MGCIDIEKSKFKVTQDGIYLTCGEGSVTTNVTSKVIKALCSYMDFRYVSGKSSMDIIIAREEGNNIYTQEGTLKWDRTFPTVINPKEGLLPLDSDEPMGKIMLDGKELKAEPQSIASHMRKHLVSIGFCLGSLAIMDDEEVKKMFNKKYILMVPYYASTEEVRVVYIIEREKFLKL